MNISENKATGDSWADKRWSATEHFNASQSELPLYRMGYLCNDYDSEDAKTVKAYVQVSRDEKWIPDTLLRALTDPSYCMSLIEQPEVKATDDSVRALMSTVSKFSYYKLGLLNYTIAADLTCNLQPSEELHQESSEADHAKNLRFDEFDQIASYVWQMFKSPAFLEESGIIEEFLHYWRGTGVCFESGYLRHILGAYGFVRLDDYEAKYFERKRDDRFKDQRVFLLE